MGRREYIFCPEGVKAPLRSLVKRQGLNDHEFGIPYVTTGIRGAVVYEGRMEITEQTSYTDEEYEYLSLTLKNTGKMTALFVELHPLLNYRTDLIIRDNFISVPPSEEHTFLVKAHRGGELKLAQTGFYITAFNADTITAVPGGEVILYMGRRDSIAREFRGYFGDEMSAQTVTEANGREIEAADVNYLAEGKVTFYFSTSNRKDVCLRIHTADSSAAPCRMTVLLNGQKASVITMEGGYGIQREKPDQLAAPKTYEVTLQGAVFAPNNTLELHIAEGWFTWDAMDMIVTDRQEEVSCMMEKL